jgi:hypothetical protein
VFSATSAVDFSHSIAAKRFNRGGLRGRGGKRVDHGGNERLRKTEGRVRVFTAKYTKGAKEIESL